MRQILFFIFPLFIFSFSLFAQDSIEVRTNTLNDQMIDAFEKSNSYQEYKVIKKTQLATLRKNILDSVSNLDQKIEMQYSDLEKQKIAIDSLRGSLKETNETLSLSQEKEDGIHIFGLLTSKTTYNAVMWSIIAVLLLIGGFLFYRFLNSHKIIKAAELKIAEMEMEIEDYRRNSLDREQKLRRKLQDEINKNRKI